MKSLESIKDFIFNTVNGFKFKLKGESEENNAKPVRIVPIYTFDVGGNIYNYTPCPDSKHVEFQIYNNLIVDFCSDGHIVISRIDKAFNYNTNLYEVFGIPEPGASYEFLCRRFFKMEVE